MQRIWIQKVHYHTYTPYTQWQLENRIPFDFIFSSMPTEWGPGEEAIVVMEDSMVLIISNYVQRCVMVGKPACSPKRSELQAMSCPRLNISIYSSTHSGKYHILLSGSHALVSQSLILIGIITSLIFQPHPLPLAITKMDGSCGNSSILSPLRTPPPYFSI